VKRAFFGMGLIAKSREKALIALTFRLVLLRNPHPATASLPGLPNFEFRQLGLSNTAFWKSIVP
jgi:hypothetical protein